MTSGRMRPDGRGGYHYTNTSGSGFSSGHMRPDGRGGYNISSSSDHSGVLVLYGIGFVLFVVIVVPLLLLYAVDDLNTKHDQSSVVTKCEQAWANLSQDEVNARLKEYQAEVAMVDPKDDLVATKGRYLRACVENKLTTPAITADSASKYCTRKWFDIPARQKEAMIADFYVQHPELVEPLPHIFAIDERTQAQYVDECTNQMLTTTTTISK